MQKKRLPQSLAPIVASSLLALAATQAAALGLASIEPSTVLGRPLDHAIPLQLEPGEELDPKCVVAEVVIGETRLPADAVRARIQRNAAGAPLLRVSTLVPVDEPLVAMTVALGCPVKLQRRFVVFADPVAAAAPSAPLVAAVEAVVDEPAAAAAAQPAAPSAARGRNAAPAPTASEAAAAAPAARPRRAVRRAAAPAANAPVRSSARPRLRLDAEEPVRTAGAAPAGADTAQAAEAAAAAETAARLTAEAAAAAAQAASAAAQRMALLEQVVERMRRESAADREALRELRQRASDADLRARGAPRLLALAGALALLCLWLLLQLRRVQRERGDAWAKVAHGTHGAAAASPQESAGGVATVTGGGRTESAAAYAEMAQGHTSSGAYSTTNPGVLGPPIGVVSSPEEAPFTRVERTEVLPVGWREDGDAPRDVSVEELIDLEQQAEFFVVLGQEEAAIDLLVDHLRNTGGGSPMPYLKLLEIYRRRGDREAYERTRARFNHRFNAYAPDWGSDASAGRVLEDYPAVITRLQLVWPVPIDAMAELESLLFRKTRGELFDLPAYRDVIFLYSLAHDLFDREQIESGNVDVLLPISEGDERTQAMAFEDLPAADDSTLAGLDQPTVPLDLDVTQPMLPQSMFTAGVPGRRGSGRPRGAP